ncbi:GtrA family protein [Ligilactobacillus murinus]|uniref:GtrA family protein n=1 Tax=Ligilactobacillus murinus TaxID=1622 RepID=UPI0012982D95|nr:GtrA family protein [Ligilactobacillus murinus]
MLKFILVGIVNTIFGMGIMFIFYNFFHFSYWVSSASNYIFGSILSYFLNKHFTFQNKSKSLATVIKFTVNITICYLIAYNVAKPLAMWSFSGFDTHVQNNIAMLALDIAAFVGFISSVISGLGILFIVARYLLHGDPTSGWASTICIMLFIGGIQLFCLGIVGKYIGKIFTEVKKRPVYIIKEKK